MPSRWWRFGQEATPEAWKGRVEADVAASAPQAMVKAGDGPALPVSGVSIELAAPVRAEFEAGIRASVMSAFEVDGNFASTPPRHQMFPCSLTPAEEDAPETTPVRPARPASWRSTPHPFTASRPGDCGACGLSAENSIHTPAEFAPWPDLRAVKR